MVQLWLICSDRWSDLTVKVSLIYSDRLCVSEISQNWYVARGHVMVKLHTSNLIYTYNYHICRALKLAKIKQHLRTKKWQTVTADHGVLFAYCGYEMAWPCFINIYVYCLMLYIYSAHNTSLKVHLKSINRQFDTAFAVIFPIFLTTKALLLQWKLCNATVNWYISKFTEFINVSKRFNQPRLQFLFACLFSNWLAVSCFSFRKAFVKCLSL